MRKRNNLFKIFSLTICFLLLLTSCATNKAKENVSKPSPSNSDVSSVVSLPEEHDTPDTTPKYDDLLGEMVDCGKTVMAYGDLKLQEYATALSNLEKILDGYTHNISVVAYSIDGKKAVSYNTDKAMFCACTVKRSATSFSQTFFPPS